MHPASCGPAADASPDSTNTCLANQPSTLPVPKSSAHKWKVASAKQISGGTRPNPMIRIAGPAASQSATTA